MKRKMKRTDLMTRAAIINAVTDVLISSKISPEDPLLTKAIIVYQYHCELESGGHESLFRWFGQQIKEMGIDRYEHILLETFEEIGAHNYVLLEKTYCKKSWNLYVALEKDEIHEDAFYQVLEKATAAYYALQDELRDLLETYFMTIYTDLIEVVEV